MGRARRIAHGVGMTAVVRVFYHQGVTTAAVAAGTRFTADSVAMLKQPYIEKASVTATTMSAQSVAAAPSKTHIAYVQVQEGKAVHYEVNPPNRSVSASTSSPILSGSTQLECGDGWSLSFLEHEVT